LEAKWNEIEKKLAELKELTHSASVSMTKMELSRRSAIGKQSFKKPRLQPLRALMNGSKD
jgi:hypothetical protein